MFNLAALLTGAMSAFASLQHHDSTGTLADPNASLPDKAKALGGAIENAGIDVVEQGLTSKLGPEGAVVAEFAVPLLQNVVAAANAKIDAMVSGSAAATSAGAANQVVHGS